MNIEVMQNSINNPNSKHSLTSLNNIKPKERGGKRINHSLSPSNSIDDKYFKETPSFPLVSIITVVFNGERFIEKTINSVINQTYKNIEYIVIDGESTDKTLEIIRRYEKYIDYWISEPDKGIYNAMNKGIKLSHGKLIGLINSDDWYLENAVEVAVKTYLNHSQSNVIITGAVYRTDSEDNILFKLNKPASFLHKKIDKIMPVNHPATFVERIVYEKIGLFNETYKIAGDYDFIYRAFYSKKVEFLFTEACLAYMRLDGLSEKISNSILRAKENFRVRKNQIKLFSNLYVFLRLLLWDISKKIIQKILGKLPSFIYYKWRYNGNYCPFKKEVKN